MAKQNKTKQYVCNDNKQHMQRIVLNCQIGQWLFRSISFRFSSKIKISSISAEDFLLFCDTVCGFANFFVFSFIFFKFFVAFFSVTLSFFPVCVFFLFIFFFLLCRLIVHYCSSVQCIELHRTTSAIIVIPSFQTK